MNSDPNLPGEAGPTTLQKKVCLLGEFAVGKTSLVKRFVEGRFDDRYLSTIGVKISRRQMTRPYGRLNLLVWDLAGSDEFNGVTRANYLRGAAGALIVCDLTRHQTLGGFWRYVEQLEALRLSIPLVLVGNKNDLPDERAISADELLSVSTQLNAPYFLSSAKTGENVEAVFENLASQIEARR